MAGPENSSQPEAGQSWGAWRCGSGEVAWPLCSRPAQQSTCSAGSRRGLCWKSAFNLGFLFSALGDRPDCLSFKLFHTSFSKLSSESKEGGGREEAGWREQRPFPGDREPSPPRKALQLWTSGPTDFVSRSPSGSGIRTRGSPLPSHPHSPSPVRPLWPVLLSPGQALAHHTQWHSLGT